MRAFYVTLFLSALIAPGAQGQGQSQPAADGTVRKDCSCGVTHRTSHAAHPHRPVLPGERAQTSHLNREYLAAARAAPPPQEPDGAQQAYQDRLKNYRVLAESYERRMADYRRLHPAAQAYLPPSDEAHRQDAARLDPTQGYNRGSGNGN